MNRQAEALMDPEISAILHYIPQIRIRNLEIKELQSHSIQTPFSFVLEKFDPVQQTIDIEFLSEGWRQHIALGKKEYKLFLQPGLHSHEYLELMIVLSGSVSNNVEGEIFTYQSGQGCLMNLHIRHQELPISHAEVLFITLQREFLQELLNAMNAEKTFFRGSTLSDFLHEVTGGSIDGSFQKNYIDFSPFLRFDEPGTGHSLLCVNAVEALRAKRPGCGFLARAAILGFLNDLGEASLYSLQSTSASLSHAEFLASKIDLLIRASHGSIRIRELEERLAYNGSYLTRLYRQQKGLSVSEACREVRIQDVKYLLRHSDMTVDEIMNSLGITSRSHFFSQFQQAEKMTPGEYRKKTGTGGKKGLS